MDPKLCIIPITWTVLCLWIAFASANRSLDNNSFSKNHTKLSNPSHENETKLLPPMVESSQISPILEWYVSSGKVEFDFTPVMEALESHEANNMVDLRSLFTEEPIIRSFTTAMNEICSIPSKMRLPYLSRSFTELGRKLASRITLVKEDLVGFIQKYSVRSKLAPILLMNVVETSFANRLDRIPSNQDNFKNLSIDISPKKFPVLMDAINGYSESLGNMLSGLVNSRRSCIDSMKLDENLNVIKKMIIKSLRWGSSSMVSSMKSLDRYALDSMSQELLDSTIDSLSDVIKDRFLMNNNTDDDMAHFPYWKVSNLNALIDKSYGSPWSVFLFEDLGSAERVIKLYASLISRVPRELKKDFSNLYIEAMIMNLRKTMPMFVTMQAQFREPAKTEPLLQLKKDTSEYVNGPLGRLDKQRLPARCYLAGRRWRLIIARAFKDYEHSGDIITNFADQIADIKSQLLDNAYNDIYRLCLPRLEVGLRGWGINGDPQPDEQAKAQFPMKNPLDGIANLRDPFFNGFELGYEFGFEIGYNIERNATSDIESNTEDLQVKRQLNKTTEFLQPKVSLSNSVPSEEYVSLICSRKAMSSSAKRVSSIAIHEGYLAAVQVPLHTGLDIVVQIGSLLGKLRGQSFGEQEGGEAGRATANTIIRQYSSIPYDLQVKLVNIGEDRGKKVGKDIGGNLGFHLGGNAARLAYLMSIANGGHYKHIKNFLKEFTLGAEFGFDHGITEGTRVASSPDLDPSAPRQIKRFLDQPRKIVSDSSDFWDDLIPTLNSSIIDIAHGAANHILIRGKLSGKFVSLVDRKQELTRTAFNNQTQFIEVDVSGYQTADTNIAYLYLNGTAEKRGNLIGLLTLYDNKLSGFNDTVAMDVL